MNTAMHIGNKPISLNKLICKLHFVPISPLCFLKFNAWHRKYKNKAMFSSISHRYLIHISSIFHPYLIYISSISHPYLIYISSISHPYLIHISSISHPYIIHISSISHPNLIHISFNLATSDELFSCIKN